MDQLPEGADRQLIGDELPKGMERRLVLRLLSHWRELCGEREFPSFAELDPARIAEIWPDCFVLDTLGNVDDPIFRAFGTAIVESDGMNFIDKRVSEVPEKTLVAAAVAYRDDVLKKGVPISRGGEFFKPGGIRVLYRSVLLPMSDDGEVISGLLGAANSREVTEEEGE